MINQLHSGIIELLRANCSCQFPEKNLHEENLIPLCTEDANGAYIQVIYRAKLLTVAGYSEGELINTIETWRRSTQFMGDDSLLMSISESCPTRIEYATQPLCRTEPIMECPVSVATLVAYLLGELALIVALLVIGLMVAVCITKSRRKRSVYTVEPPIQDPPR